MNIIHRRPRVVHKVILSSGFIYGYNVIVSLCVYATCLSVAALSVAFYVSKKLTCLFVVYKMLQIADAKELKSICWVMLWDEWETDTESAKYWYNVFVTFSLRSSFVLRILDFIVKINVFFVCISLVLYGIVLNFRFVKNSSLFFVCSFECSDIEINKYSFIFFLLFNHLFS